MIFRWNDLGRAVAGIACSLFLFACTEEGANDIGGPLLPGADLRTFEVFLEPAQYLTYDTAFAGYADAYDTNFLQLMRGFEGVVDANVLFRYSALPATLQVLDAAGSVRTDSTPSFPNGYLMLRIDTVKSRGTGTIAVHHLTQEFDPATATWIVRSDTGGVRQLWTQPGGTAGAQVGTATWAGGSADSLMIALDSVMIRALTDSVNLKRGTLVTLDQTGTNGASLRVSAAVLRINGKSTIRPDTTVVISINPIISTFIFTPSPEAVGNAARVSGVPAWRSVIGFQDNLGDISVPCPGTGCTVRLRDAHVNLAELLLRPTASAQGFSPEDSIRVDASALLESSSVPLERSPIANVVGGTRVKIARDRFRENDNGPDVRLELDRAMISAMITDTVTTAERVPRRIALLTTPEAATFGFAAFRDSPRLRLILTISTEQRP